MKISGKETMLKNQSYFKQSMGDEAGAPRRRAWWSVNRGKVYFTTWSMDVKIEGENAVRHLDMTTHNHGSPINTGPWPFVDTAAIIMAGDPCEAENTARTAWKGRDKDILCVGRVERGPSTRGYDGKFGRAARAGTALWCRQPAGLL